VWSASRRLRARSIAWVEVNGVNGLGAVLIHAASRQRFAVALMALAVRAMMGIRAPRCRRTVLALGAEWRGVARKTSMRESAIHQEASYRVFCTASPACFPFRYNLTESRIEEDLGTRSGSLVVLGHQDVERAMRRCETGPGDWPTGRAGADNARHWRWRS